MKNRKQINKDIKVIKNLFKGIISILGKALFTLVKNLLYIFYVLVYNFHNLVAKLYMKAPRVARIIIIYILITLSLMNFIGIKKVNANNNTNMPQISQETPQNEEKTQKEYNSIIEEKSSSNGLKNDKIEDTKKSEEKTTCKLGEIECKIYNNGIAKGMTHEQALLVVAISKHETGNWTSSAFKNKNNFGGMMCKTGLATYKSFDEGLNKFTTLLNDYYFAKGRNTIEKIGAIYCPVGAKNDPNGLNRHWIPRVTEYYNDYLKKF